MDSWRIRAHGLIVSAYLFAYRPRKIREEPLLSRRALVGLIAVVALPIPLVSASGLSVPLPGFVQRVAFMLVPGATRASSTAYAPAVTVPIVPTTGERVAARRPTGLPSVSVVKGERVPAFGSRAHAASRMVAVDPVAAPMASADAVTSSGDTPAVQSASNTATVSSHGGTNGDASNASGSGGGTPQSTGASNGTGGIGASKTGGTTTTSADSSSTTGLDAASLDNTGSESSSNPGGSISSNPGGNSSSNAGGNGSSNEKGGGKGGTSVASGTG